MKYLMLLLAFVWFMGGYAVAQFTPAEVQSIGSQLKSPPVVEYWNGVVAIARFENDHVVFQRYTRIKGVQDTRNVQGIRMTKAEWMKYLPILLDALDEDGDGKLRMSGMVWQTTKVGKGWRLDRTPYSQVPTFVEPTGKTETYLEKSSEEVN